jgi:superfamily II DNA or RNA helicase
MAKNLFDHDHNRKWPPQEKFPINENSQGSHVNPVLLGDIKNTTDLIVITGFTSLSHLVETFGITDYKNLKRTRIVIGFDIDERVSKKLIHYTLLPEVKEFWVKQGVSIKLCGPKINIIEKIKNKEIDFRSKKRLHAKIYVGDNYAMLGSSNFSKSGLVNQREANIRVGKENDSTEQTQYDSIKLLANNYFELAEDYNEGIIELLDSLLKDATWEEALARAVAEILENKWMKDFPILYKAIINTEMWPSQRMGIARAMSIIQDLGNVLLADPTGSGKTKLATTLAYTLFHWLGENGHTDRSSALIIAPPQVMDNWDAEGRKFTLYNRVESMGKLSNSKLKTLKELQKEIEKVDILIIDESHNYLNHKSKRSSSLRPKHSSHIILSTATPINKSPKDLLRLIELLDIDNLSDDNLKTYFELHKKRNKAIEEKDIDALRNYVNQFIVRRTKKELNKMIDREQDEYKNSIGHRCRFPNTISETYETGETDKDKEIAREINQLMEQLKGVNNLQNLKPPVWMENEDDKKNYLLQRFNSAPALASFKIRSCLRSSEVALYEHIYGTTAAKDKYGVKSHKSDSGDILSKLKKSKEKLPKKYFPADWFLEEHSWILNKVTYTERCEKEIRIYEQIGKLCLQLSGKREKEKAKTLLEKVNRFNKVLAFDSTVITLDYLQMLIEKENSSVQVIVATGQNEKNKKLVRDKFDISQSDNQTKLIALCSDAMSEGINLQSAKALILLDMPSVLRIIEQRIGRLERMDSEHNEVHIFWPNDSDEFSLKGDQRVVETLLLTEKLIRGNVDIPEKIYEKHLRNGMTTQNFINAYNEFSAEEVEWQGVRDSTQSLYSLIEGKEAMINKKTYEMYKDVEGTVKTAVSFVESDRTWSFFCFKGSSIKSPKWLFIDDKNNAFTDFSEITEKLKIYLDKTKIEQRKWEEVSTTEVINDVIKKLKRKERDLLPNKKKRALKVAKEILEQLKKNETKQSDNRKEIIYELISLFKPHSNDDSIIDYDRFAEMWLTILQPALDEKRILQKRKRKIISLQDLTYTDVNLDDKTLLAIYESCQVATTLDEMIASCIIAIKK